MMQKFHLRFLVDILRGLYAMRRSTLTHLTLSLILLITTLAAAPIQDLSGRANLRFAGDLTGLNRNARRETTKQILKRLGGYPCLDSDFTCVTLTMPLDHFNPGDARTIDVVFAVLPATGHRKGMFVTATG